MNDRSNNYTTHSDLLAQVASSADEDAHVRRVLGARLTEADLEARESFKSGPLRACSRCESGMTGCATPDACERAEDSLGAARGVVYAIPLALALWAAIALVLLAMGGVQL